MAKVKKIPATISRTTSEPLNSTKKRRVAGYARVSTDQEEQQTSYAAQMDYYSHYIESRDDWEFAGMYSDEGISATSTKHREGFNRMVSDALAGKIDLIITKSVSRFARNTVDSLTTIRKLKEKGIEVFFEKENIWTLDSKGELLISIMSSLSQEESRSISENTTWGRRKAFSDGKYSLAYKNFLGYDKGPDGKLVINPEQAEIVRLIYRLFLDGLSATAIAKELTNRGIKTMTGKDKWTAYVVNYALSNEKYAGSALLQKKFTESFLTKKQIKNTGQIPQYFVEDDHPAIIDKRTWELVQAERQLRQQKGRGRHSGTCIFSSKIKCGDCGGWYGSKIWHSNDQYRRRVWQCNRKYEGKKCTTTHLTDDEIKELFVKALNNILKEKDEIVDNLKILLETIPDTSELEKESVEAAAEKDVLAGLVDSAIEENASKAQDQEEYEKNFNSLMERYEAQKKKCDDLAVQIAKLKAKKRQMENFIETVGKMEGCISEFDERLWGSLVDHLTVYDRNRIVFTFKGGQETTVSMD